MAGQVCAYVFICWLRECSTFESNGCRNDAFNLPERIFDMPEASGAKCCCFQFRPFRIVVQCTCSFSSVTRKLPRQYEYRDSDHDDRDKTSSTHMPFLPLSGSVISFEHVARCCSFARQKNLGTQGIQRQEYAQSGSRKYQRGVTDCRASRWLDHVAGNKPLQAGSD